MPGPLELSDSVVSVLSQYLTRRSEVGHAAFNAQLEDLLGLVELKLSEPYAAEMFARWTANPSDAVESQTLRLHLAREIDRDPDFARELTTKLGGPMPPPRRPRAKWILAAAGVVAALGAGFLLARATGSPGTTVQAAPSPTTATVTTTTTTVPTTTGSTETTTTTTGETSTGLAAQSPGVPGDGSTLSKGVPVFLADLPVPNSQWTFDHGDHDVQITQYPQSLWHELNTCYSSHSGEQQFRLKNFNRIEVKATGTDSTSDPTLTVKFEIFANNDAVHPLASVVANPGEAKPLAVDLPKDVFALTLRASLTTVDKSKCRQGNAVWGSPYVIAAGS